MWTWPNAEQITEAFRESMTWYSRMETMHEKPKENGVLPRAGDNGVSLILANLTDSEFDAFHTHHVPYSGSTGKGAVCGYEPHGPYIATFWSEFERAMHILGWTHIELERVAPHQVVVNRAHHRRHSHATWRSDLEAMREAEATAEVLVGARVIDALLASSPGTNAKENGDRPSVSIEGLIWVVEQQQCTIAELTKAVQANALTAINAIERSR